MQNLTLRTRTRYELIDGKHTEHLRGNWIIHWHTADGFTTLAHTAGLTVTRSSPVEDGEIAVHLRRA